MFFLKATKKRKVQFPKSNSLSLFTKIKNKLFTKNKKSKLNQTKQKNIFIFLKLNLKNLMIFSIFLFGLFYVWNLVIIKKIDCKLDGESCNLEILQKFNFLKGKFLYTPIDNNELETVYQTYSWIDKINGRPDFPNMMKINIFSLKPLAVIVDRFEKQYFLADNGKIFIFDKNVKGLVSIKTEKAIILSEQDDDSEFVFAAEIIKYLQINHLQIEKIIELSDQYWEFDLKMGKKVYFTQEKTAQMQVDALQFILINSKMNEVGKYREVDLRYLDPVLR